MGWNHRHTLPFLLQSHTTIHKYVTWHTGSNWLTAINWDAVLLQQVVNVCLWPRLATFTHQHQQTSTSINVALYYVKLKQAHTTNVGQHRDNVSSCYSVVWQCPDVCQGCWCEAELSVGNVRPRVSREEGDGGGAHIISRQAMLYGGGCSHHQPTSHAFSSIITELAHDVTTNILKLFFADVGHRSTSQFMWCGPQRALFTARCSSLAADMAYNASTLVYSLFLSTVLCATADHSTVILPNMKTIKSFLSFSYWEVFIYLFITCTVIYYSAVVGSCTQ